MPLQVLAAAMAGVGVYELFNMKGLEIKSLEGILSILAAVLLVLPKAQWFNFLPESVTNFTLFYLIVMFILMVPVFSKTVIHLMMWRFQF